MIKKRKADKLERGMADIFFFIYLSHFYIVRYTLTRPQSSPAPNPLTPPVPNPHPPPILSPHHIFIFSDTILNVVSIHRKDMCERNAWRIGILSYLKPSILFPNFYATPQQTRIARDEDGNYNQEHPGEDH